MSRQIRPVRAWFHEVRGIAALLPVVLAALTSACGGSSSGETAQIHHLASISVGPPTLTVAAGLTQKYTATGLYDDGTRADISASAVWASSDAHVAALALTSGQIPLATTAAPGVTTITATFDGISGSATLTVSAATLVSVGVTPAASSMAIGLTRQLSAIGTFSDHSIQDLTAAAAWSTSDTHIAAIDSAGLASASSPGVATMTASYQGISGATTLTVTAATLVSVGITPGSASVPNGTAQLLHATGLYSDGSQQDLTAVATWTSSAPAIATVSNTAGSAGTISTLAAGTTTITATAGGIAGTASLTVTAATLASITVTSPASSVANGTQQPFTATGTWTDGTTHDVTSSVVWTSSAITVATISNAAGFEGHATAVGVGSVVITAAANNVAGTSITGNTTLAVTAATLVSIAITPLVPGVIIGAATSLTATGTYTDNSVQTLTNAVTWTSSDTTLASISNATGTGGVVTGIALGTVAITAQLNSIASAAVTLTVNPVPEYAYVANLGDNNVSQYAIGTDGSLTPLATATVAAGMGPISIALDPANRYAYVANTSDNTVSQYTIGADGTLSPMSPATIATGTTPTSVTVAPTGLTVYVVAQDGTISQYLVGSDGTLSAATPATVMTGQSAKAITLNHAGSFAYVVDYLHYLIWQYAVGSDGLLTPLGTPTVASGWLPHSIVVHPNDQFAYVTNQYGSTVTQFAIVTGSLTPLAPPTASAGNEPIALTIDSTGRYAYVTNFLDSNASQYSVGSDGALTPASTATVSAGNYPTSLSIEPKNHFAYVANEGDSTVSIYTVGLTGLLTPTGAAPVATGSYPVCIVTAY